MTDGRISREAMLRWKSIRLGEKLPEVRHECDATEDRTPRGNKGRVVDCRDDESETGEPNWKCWGGGSASERAKHGGASQLSDGSGQTPRANAAFCRDVSSPLYVVLWAYFNYILLLSSSVYCVRSRKIIPMDGGGGS